MLISGAAYPAARKLCSINLQTQYSDSELESQLLFLHICYALNATQKKNPETFASGFKKLSLS